MVGQNLFDQCEEFVLKTLSPASNVLTSLPLYLFSSILTYSVDHNASDKNSIDTLQNPSDELASDSPKDQNELDQ